MIEANLAKALAKMQDYSNQGVDVLLLSDFNEKLGNTKSGLPRNDAVESAGGKFLDCQFRPDTHLL